MSVWSPDRRFFALAAVFGCALAGDCAVAQPAAGPISTAPHEYVEPEAPTPSVSTEPPPKVTIPVASTSRGALTTYVTGTVDRTAPSSVRLVQLAASKSMEDAQKTLESASPLISAPLVGRIQPAVAGNSVWYRAQVVGFETRDAAQDFCVAWKRRGGDCIVR